MDANKKIERFEDLIAWQKARFLTARIYQLTNQGSIARDFGLRDQMRRAAVSIMANIAEGFERHRLREFHQFLSIAKSSLAELRSHLYVAQDAGYCAGTEFDNLIAHAVEIGKIIGGLRASVEGRINPQSNPDV
jgi:four helix bundle protein